MSTSLYLPRSYAGSRVLLSHNRRTGDAEDITNLFNGESLKESQIHDAFSCYSCNFGGDVQGVMDRSPQHPTFVAKKAVSRGPPELRFSIAPGVTYELRRYAPIIGGGN